MTVYKAVSLTTLLVFLAVPAFGHGIDSNRPRNDVEIEGSNTGDITQTNNTIGGNNRVEGGEGGEANITNENLNINISDSDSRSSSRSRSESEAIGVGVGTSVVKDKNKQSTTVNITQTESNEVEVPASAPSPVSPDLVTGRDTCMGSVSGGAGASTGMIGAGFSFGKTYVDKDCNRRKYAAMLDHMGHREAALALIAQNKDVSNALRAAGVKVATLEKAAKPEPVAANATYDHGWNPWDSEGDE